MGCQCWGGGDWVRERPGHAVVLGVGSPVAKRDIADRLRTAGAIFPSFVARGVRIGEDVMLGEGCVVCAGSILTTNIILAPFVMLNLNVTVGHDVRIGAYTTVSLGSNISGKAIIGEDCDLGTNCTVLPGVRIGDGAILGAMACATRDLEGNVIAIGVPAKIIKHR